MHYLQYQTINHLLCVLNRYNLDVEYEGGILWDLPVPGARLAVTHVGGERDGGALAQRHLLHACTCHVSRVATCCDAASPRSKPVMTSPAPKVKVKGTPNSREDSMKLQLSRNSAYSVVTLWPARGKVLPSPWSYNLMINIYLGINRLSTIPTDRRGPWRGRWISPEPRR